jgi:arylformamidase
MRLIDISPLLEDDMVVWPGDTRFRRTTNSTVADAGCRLSEITTTLHAGAHADAPVHVIEGSLDIAALPLDAYIGRCVVVDVSAAGARPITAGDFPLEPIAAPRLLFRTGTFSDWRRWSESFASIAPELIDALANRGVILVGIDTPSVDAWGAGLEVHRSLAARRIATLEGLVLDGVPAGEYELIAPPLRIRGGDGSPVRALLRTI